MSQTVVLNLPDEIAKRYGRGAAVARRRLDEFVVERLVEAAPLLAEETPSPFGEDLVTLEQLDDGELWEVTRLKLVPEKQRVYSRLLRKNSQEAITPQEEARLRALGEEARLIALRKAHAFMLLRWRGHRIPSPPSCPEVD